MKISAIDYKILSDAIQKVRKNNPQITLETYRDYYINNGSEDYAMRWRWDLIHAGEKFMPKGFMCNVLYKYLNDAHIDTALKKIVQEPV